MRGPCDGVQRKLGMALDKFTLSGEDSDKDTSNVIKLAHFVSHIASGVAQRCRNFNENTDPYRFQRSKLCLLLAAIIKYQYVSGPRPEVGPATNFPRCRFEPVQTRWNGSSFSERHVFRIQMGLLHRARQTGCSGLATTFAHGPRSARKGLESGLYNLVQ